MVPTNDTDLTESKEPRLHSDFVLVVFSLVASLVCYFLSRVVMARSLSVADFGAVSYALTIGTTAGFLLMTGREHEALVQIPTMSESELRREIQYLIRIVSIFGLILTPLAIFVSYQLSLDFRIWAIIGFTLMNVCIQAIIYTLSSKKNFGYSLVVNLFLFAGVFGIVLLTDYQGILTAPLSVFIFVIFYIVASFIGITILYRLYGSSSDIDNSNTASLELWNLRRIDRNLMRYFLVDLGITLLPIVPLVMLEPFLGLESVGYFSVAFMVYRATIIFARAIFRIYSPIQAETYHTNKQKFTESVVESLYLMIALQGSVTIGLVFSGEFFLNLLVGASYESSVLLLQILLIGVSFEAFYVIMSSPLRMANESYRLMRINIIAVVIAIVLTPTLVIIYGIIGAALAYSLTIIVQSIFTFEAIRNIREEMFHSWHDAVKLKIPLILLVTLSFICIFQISFNLSFQNEIITGGILAIGFFVVTLYIRRISKRKFDIAKNQQVQ